MAHPSQYGAGYGASAARTDGVLTRRFLAYLVDLLVIFGLSLLFGLLIGVAGILTLGAAWMLYAVLVPATAILYSAVTVGGRSQATVGMRISASRPSIPRQAGRSVRSSPASMQGCSMSASAPSCCSSSTSRSASRGPTDGSATTSSSE